MTEAYVVRDPEGRVIGMSVSGSAQALDDVYQNDLLDNDGFSVPYVPLIAMFNRDGSANVNGYTLKREQVAL